MKKPLLLAILDGYGLGTPGPHNAILAASTPNLDGLFARYPHTTLACSGLDVGLPAGQMGNSEVGHTNMGAGRVVYQDLTRITKAIEEGDFQHNPAILAAIGHAAGTGGTVHLMGLLSDGGVHSHTSHLFALLELCRAQGVKTRVHCILDGRDTPPQSGIDYVRRLEQKLAAVGGDLAVATVCGRFYAMDRDQRWDRVEKAYAAYVYEDAPLVPSPSEAVAASYAQGVSDEFMLPVVCTGGDGIRSRDTVIFYNFRPDRAREITRALVDPAFDGFARKGGAVAPYYLCFTQYDASMPGVQVAFAPQSLSNILGEYISKQGLTQLRIAETEKYAHVTFFFNGGEEGQFAGEDRILIPSPKVATYDLQPEMSAAEVNARCIEAVQSGKYDVIILNFANCDMVGHTGVFSAAVRAVEAVDACIGPLYRAMEAAGGLMLITADHGNADQMEEGGQPFTAHTTNPVPLLLTREDVRLKSGRLCDIAPTMLQLLGLKPPEEMTGRSLLMDQ